MLNRRSRVSFLLVANALISMLLMAFAVTPSIAQNLTKANSAKAAPKPLYRDPVHDGAADPSLIWNRAEKKWMMFYTNRRADIPNPDPKDVTWVHRSEEHTSEL